MKLSSYCVCLFSCLILQVGAADSLVKHFSIGYGSSPSSCRKKMQGYGYSILRDSTLVRVYISGHERAPKKIEKTVERLGLRGPYGYQYWKTKTEMVKLYFASSVGLEKKGTTENLMLIWVERSKIHKNTQPHAHGEEKRGEDSVRMAPD